MGGGDGGRVGGERKGADCTLCTLCIMCMCVCIKRGK